MNTLYRSAHQTVVVILAFLLSSGTFAQSGAMEQRGNSIVVRAGRILDVRSGTYVNGAAIYVEGERIKAVGPAADVLKQAPTTARIIDLGDATMVPGLIDCHTHLMARIPDVPNGYGVNLLTKSQAYRALEGVANARITLEAGFTTVRDVKTKGPGTRTWRFATQSTKDSWKDRACW